ncbi:DNA cytosine methyltransferase [Hymenobacter glacieicola]|uniref:DNA cytosine methyltransferase n=1 Tax=Hymenobacter glacieicola TaxID=1562124 RepID=UPI00357131EF
MGWATAILVEWEEFPRQVLIKNFHCVPAEDLSPAELAGIIAAWKAWKPGQPRPTTVLYGDICHFAAAAWRGAIDLVCGGFPCQPYSDAGKKLGNDDPRALFPQMLRVIRELAPGWVLGENVRGLLSQAKGLAFESVCAGLEAEGYEVQPLLLPAAGVGAPHKRDRFWFVAHAHHGQPERPEQQVRSGRHAAGLRGEAAAHAESEQGRGLQQSWLQTNPVSGSATYSHSERQPQPEGSQCQLGRWAEHGGEEAAADSGSLGCPDGLHGAGQAGAGQANQSRNADTLCWQVPDFRLTEPPLCRADDGLPAGLVRVSTRAKQLKGYGNAIVPQVAYQLFLAIADWIALYA